MGSDELTGTISTRLMPREVLASLNTRPEKLRLTPSPQCAAFEYTRLARGERDFALYYRLLPWDHAPGALILQEVGGVARHPYGGDYAPRDDRPLLLIAADGARWESARRALAGPDRPTET